MKIHLFKENRPQKNRPHMVTEAKADEPVSSYMNARKEKE